MGDETVLVKLTPDEINTRRILVEKFRQGLISRDEAEKLRQLLEKERQEVSESGDLMLLFGIILLLGLVIDYLGDKDIDSLKKSIDEFVWGKKRKKTLW
jgi:uncharacterized membrane protein